MATNDDEIARSLGIVRRTRSARCAVVCNVGSSAVPSASTSYRPELGVWVRILRRATLDPSRGQRTTHAVVLEHRGTARPARASAVPSDHAKDIAPHYRVSGGDFRQPASIVDRKDGYGRSVYLCRQDRSADQRWQAWAARDSTVARSSFTPHQAGSRWHCYHAISVRTPRFRSESSCRRTLKRTEDYFHRSSRPIRTSCDSRNEHSHIRDRRTIPSR